jgi:hypothetical protein
MRVEAGDIHFTRPRRVHHHVQGLRDLEEPVALGGEALAFGEAPFQLESARADLTPKHGRPREREGDEQDEGEHDRDVASELLGEGNGRRRDREGALHDAAHGGRGADAFKGGGERCEVAAAAFEGHEVVGGGGHVDLHEVPQAELRGDVAQGQPVARDEGCLARDQLLHRLELVGAQAQAWALEPRAA